MGSTATTVPSGDVLPPQQQEVFNPYPAADGKERSRQLKDYNGDESKYKLWIQMVENYLLANAQ